MDTCMVQAAYSINQNLVGRSATGSIVLLLRNDVFSRIALSLPDSQKMRDDLSFDLDWRVLSGSAGIRAPLIRLVNSKAARALGIEQVSVLDYFPEHIKVGRQAVSAQFTSLQYLLNLTRHTPRDLLRLLEEIRKIEAAEIYPSTGYVLSADVIREGVLQYSAKYFVGAIRNEFAGFEGGPESSAAAISALQRIGSQRFDRDDFTRQLAEIDPSQDPDRLLTLLFYAGAIGNLVAGRSHSYLQFYHRRDEAEIYLRGTFLLHNALVHAWNVPRDNP